MFKKLLSMPSIFSSVSLKVLGFKAVIYFEFLYILKAFEVLLLIFFYLLVNILVLWVIK